MNLTLQKTLPGPWCDLLQGPGRPSPRPLTALSLMLSQHPRVCAPRLDSPAGNATPPAAGSAAGLAPPGVTLAAEPLRAGPRFPHLRPGEGSRAATYGPTCRKLLSLPVTGTLPHPAGGAVSVFPEETPNVLILPSRPQGTAQQRFEEERHPLLGERAPRPGHVR